jgi:hypothetical protein
MINHHFWVIFRFSQHFWDKPVRNLWMFHSRVMGCYCFAEGYGMFYSSYLVLCHFLSVFSFPVAELRWTTGSGVEGEIIRKYDEIDRPIFEVRFWRVQFGFQGTNEPQTSPNSTVRWKMQVGYLKTVNLECPLFLRSKPFYRSTNQ